MTARKIVEVFNDAGVTGLQYWYDNNFHYIKNWHHLKDFSVAAKLPVQVIDPGRNYREINLPRSDDIMSRLISLVINGLLLMWIARSPLSVGFGVLMLSDAGRMLYGFLGADLLVWCAWAVSDVFVALAAAHLRNLQSQAMAGQSDGDPA